MSKEEAAGHAAIRLVADGNALHLAPDGVSPALESAGAALGSFADCAFGVWEAGPGTDDDTEAEELFVVLSGQGQIRFADGSIIDLFPGVIVHLREGDQTTWTITDRLRKLYMIPGSA